MNATQITAVDPRAVRLARARLRKHGPAVAGALGNPHTYTAACIAVRDFGLPREAALGVLREWNDGCVPPWPDSKLRRFLANAERYGRGEYGAALRELPPAFAEAYAEVMDALFAFSGPDVLMERLTELARSLGCRKREAEDPERLGGLLLALHDPWRNRAEKRNLEASGGLRDWLRRQTRPDATSKVRRTFRIRDAGKMPPIALAAAQGEVVTFGYATAVPDAASIGPAAGVPVSPLDPEELVGNDEAVAEIHARLTGRQVAIAERWELPARQAAREVGGTDGSVWVARHEIRAVAHRVSAAQKAGEQPEEREPLMRRVAKKARAGELPVLGAWNVTDSDALRSMTRPMTGDEWSDRLAGYPASRYRVRGEWKRAAAAAPPEQPPVKKRARRTAATTAAMRMAA